LAVTLSGEGRGNGKKPTWVWGALLRKRGERDEGWDEISLIQKFQEPVHFFHGEF